jgi:glycosyltransferase involved in cell wall biosynthesis
MQGMKWLEITAVRPCFSWWISRVQKATSGFPGNLADGKWPSFVSRHTTSACSAQPVSDRTRNCWMIDEVLTRCPKFPMPLRTLASSMSVLCLTNNPGSWPSGEDGKMTEDTRPLVSIGIPTYNRASSYLKHTLRSAVNQTYKNIEIIVSDNCSPDNPESVVKEFNDPRIRYYRQEKNIGAINNFNFCLEQSRGKYFLLLLDDDLIDEDFVSTCMDAVKCCDEPGLILTGARQIDSEGNVLSATHNTMSGYSTADFVLSWFDNKVPLYLCSTLFHTERLKQLGGLHSKTGLYEDVVAQVRLATKYGRVDVFDVKASFRRHDSNMGIVSHWYEWCEDSLYLLDIMCEAVPEQAARIRERGMSYFCLRNYRYAAGIKSPLKRFLAYLTVYRTFNYSYSLLRYLYISPIKGFLKRQIANV